MLAARRVQVLRKEDDTCVLVLCGHQCGQKLFVGMPPQDKPFLFFTACV